jgi:hypothetical protein
MRGVPYQNSQETFRLPEAHQVGSDPPRLDAGAINNTVGSGQAAEAVRVDKIDSAGNGAGLIFHDFNFLSRKS